MTTAHKSSRLPPLPSAIAAQFPAGARVLLRLCPEGRPGTVLRVARRRVVVRWADLGYVGKHDPHSLVIVGNPPPPTEAKHG